MGKDPPIDPTLCTALLDGAFESPPWTSFLEQLRDACNAEFTVLHFCPPGRPLDQALDLFSGSVAPSAILKINRRYFTADDYNAIEQMEEATTYSLEQIVALHAGEKPDLPKSLVGGRLAGLRQMRVKEATGVIALLTIVRRTSDFNPDETAVLRSIAPVLRGVLRHYVALERERFVNSLSTEAARRLRFGWLALSASGQLLDGDEQGLQIVSESGVFLKNSNGQLLAKSPSLQQEIAQALKTISENPNSRTYALTLNQEPWLDMLLVPTSRKSISTGVLPVAIAYVHGDSWRSTDCCEQLAELFGLSPSEARLALAICRGMTIAEAAEAQGISVASARTYSKNIYGKTGARGLPDLVRIVMRSVLALSPGPADSRVPMLE